ncbi:MAG: glycosyltransferase family 4 protein [Bacilli bacterium]|nr:glycosyltransferase family 4 protein [Bacilli bacterium]
MNISFILFYYLPEKTTQHYLYQPLIDKLLSQGHTVNVITPNPTRGLSKEEIKQYQKIKKENVNGVNVYRINAFTYNPNRFNKFKLLLRYLSVSFLLPRKLKNIKSDVIFTQTNPPIFLAYFVSKWAKRKKIRLVYNVQDLYPDNIFRPSSIFYHLTNPFKLKTLQSSDSIITISETMKKTLLTKINDETKIKVIYNFAISEYQSKAHEEIVRTRLKIDKTKFNVIYAGNIGYVQDLDVLLRAAELTKDNNHIVYHIVGEGSQVERIRNKIITLNLQNVFFHPMQTVEDAVYLYHLADVNIISILPHVIRTALPLKVSSCLEAKKPIVFIGLEDEIDEKWKNQHIITINKRDYHKLAKTLSELSINPRIEVTYNNEMFDREQNINSYIEEILGR